MKNNYEDHMRGEKNKILKAVNQHTYSYCNFLNQRALKSLLFHLVVFLIEVSLFVACNLWENL